MLVKSEASISKLQIVTYYKWSTVFRTSRFFRRDRYNPTWPVAREFSHQSESRSESCLTCAGHAAMGETKTVQRRNNIPNGRRNIDFHGFILHYCLYIRFMQFLIGDTLQVIYQGVWQKYREMPILTVSGVPRDCKKSTNGKLVESGLAPQWYYASFHPFLTGRCWKKSKPYCIWSFVSYWIWIYLYDLFYLSIYLSIYLSH